MSSFNRFELDGFAKRAAGAFCQGSMPLNNTIASIAEDQGLNPDQVQRVVESANALVNGWAVKQARDGGSDPRVTFERADSEAILEAIRASGMPAKIAADRQRAQVEDMFTVKEGAVDGMSVMDAVLPAVDNPYGSRPMDVNPEALAIDYCGAQELRKHADGISIHSLERACEVLDEVRKHARIENANIHESADNLHARLRENIHEQLMNGVSPASVRDAVKKAGLDPKLRIAVDEVITKQAMASEIPEGVSEITDQTIIETGHPLFKSLRDAGGLSKNASKAFGAESKIASAYRLARSDLNDAIRRELARG